MPRPIGPVPSSWLVAFPFALLLCLMGPSCQQMVNKPPVEKVTIADPTLPHAALLTFHAIPEETVKTMRKEAAGGSETILLAEDEEPIRTLAERILKEIGYTVLTAGNGEEAIEVFRRHKGTISLAVLDVVMPRMSGKAAFETIQKVNPLLKVIFMSGYTANAIHQSFVLTAGLPYLSKPFGPGSLARKVREVLDGK